jgi:pimeloyl-ACP methyl ester carboxylesterase
LPEEAAPATPPELGGFPWFRRAAADRSLDRVTGILLIHGGGHGPWCWEEFADRLAERGHDVRAVRLRGHDQRPGRIWHRVHDYLDDVRDAAAAFPEPPVLVGHSLGGLLAQRYLERHPAPGAVLMASVPPGGMSASAVRLGARHPLVLLKVNFLMSLRPLVATSELVRELLFAPGTPQAVVDRCRARLQDESYLAFVDMVALVLPRPRRVHAPVLVLGAEWDGFITVEEVHRTAQAYRTRAEIFPDMGHDMMLDTGWREVADRIDTWVRETVARGNGMVAGCCSSNDSGRGWPTGR